MRWEGRSYEIRAVNNRYRQSFRDSLTGRVLQWAGLWLVVIYLLGVGR